MHRDPAEKKQKLSPGYDMFRLRERLMREAGKGPEAPADAAVVGLPRALSSYSFLPLWRRFFAELGLRTVTSKETSDETKHRSADVCGAEFCYPAKLAHGHVAELAEREGGGHLRLPLNPPQHGAHTSEQFLGAEGFYQVIVGADVQPLHAILDLPLGG